MTIDSAELAVLPELPDVPELAELPEPVLGSLSPSRAADFKTCPLLYRFRCVDRLPESPSPAATRGTLVHSVLEQLFDLPAAQRTLDTARALLPGAWEQLRTERPELAELFVIAPDSEHAPDADASPDSGATPDSGTAPDSGGTDFAAWLGSAADLLGNYFELEDPARLEPESRELLVEVVTEGVRLRGYIDRVDVSAAGDIRVVDYKTGSTPREAFEAKALFQMKFYALVLWRIRGVVPRQLRLIYLADTDTLSYSPDAEELERFERTLMAIWAAISRALTTGDFRPSPSRLCGWCDHKALCPAFGGTPPPFPQRPVLTDPRDDPPPDSVTP